MSQHIYIEDVVPVPGLKTPRDGWPRRRIRTPSFPMPPHLAGCEDEDMDDIGIPYNGTKGAINARQAATVALAISESHRKSNMRVVSGLDGHLTLEYEHGGMDHYWNSIREQEQEKRDEQEKSLKILLHRYSEPL